MATVYIETTIPSTYVSVRTDPASVHRREDTREWWSQQRENYALLVSDAVIIELNQGEWPGQSEAIDLVKNMDALLVDEEIMTIAEKIRQRTTCPQQLVRRRGALGNCLCP